MPLPTCSPSFAFFREWKLILPPAKVVQGELHGLLSAFVTVLGSVDPVDVKRCVVEWKAYTLSDSGLAHLQIICMTSSEQPAAFRAVARPLRSECQEWQDATCSPYRRTRAECSRVSITLCVYGKPYSSANSGVSSPWSSRL